MITIMMSSGFSDYKICDSHTGKLQHSFSLALRIRRGKKQENTHACHKQGSGEVCVAYKAV